MAAPKKINPGGTKQASFDAEYPVGRGYEAGADRGQGHVDAGGVTSRKSMRPGGGGRFEAFVSRLVAEGKSQSQAKAIAADAGRKRYGSKQMARFSAEGRKRA